MLWKLTAVLMTALRCSRGSRVRLGYGFEHTKKTSTSPGGPAHSFHPSQTSAPAGTKTQMERPFIEIPCQIVKGARRL